MTKKKLLLIAILAFALSLCTACGANSSSSGGDVDHTHAYAYDLTQSTAPTESEAGTLIGKCEVCGDEISVDVPALSDTRVWSLDESSVVASTCVAEGSKTYTSLYGSITVKTPLGAHSLTDVAAVAATCEEDGAIAHKHCAVCEKDFDADGNVLESVAVAKHSATLEDVAAKDATCSEYAIAAHKKCTVCEELFAVGENGALTETTLADLTGTEYAAHTLQAVPAVPHGCDSNGVKAHDKCTVCGKLFIGGTEVNSSAIVDKAAHTLQAVTAVPHDCETDGVKAHDKCTVCGKLFIGGTEVNDSDVVDKAAHGTLTDVPAKPATCESYAIAAHKECTVCEKLLVAGEDGALTETTLADLTGTEYAAHSYDGFGECTVCGAAKFANASYSVLQGHWSGFSSSVSATLSFANGEADDTLVNKNGTASPCYYEDCSSTTSNSKISIEFKDKTKGLLKITFSYHYVETHVKDAYDDYDNCSKSNVDKDVSFDVEGYYDATSNAIIIPGMTVKNGAVDSLDYVRINVLIPGDANASKISGYFDRDICRTFTYDDEATKVNAFVDRNNNQIVIGVSFEDLSGNALAAGDIKTAPAFRVVKNGELIASYGYISGKVTKLDGLEGVYANVADPDEQITCTAIIDGKGGIIYGENLSADDNYKGAWRGSYTILEGTDNKIAVLLKNEDIAPVGCKYYEITLNVSAKTATAEMPNVSVTYNGGAGPDQGTMTVAGININVPYTVWAPSCTETDTHKFVGWQMGDNLYAAGDVIEGGLTQDVTFTAVWKQIVLLTVKDESGVRTDVTVSLLEGDSIVSALKAQYGESFEKDGDTHEVLYWFVKADGENVVIEETLSATAEDNGAVIYVHWKAYVTVGIVDRYFEGTTITYGEAESIISRLPAHGNYVDGYKFLGWYTDAVCENKLSDNAVAQTDVNLTVYAGYSDWVGDVSFELGTNYTFVWDETIGAFKSNNQGKNYSSATMYIKAVSGLNEISFDYFCSSESSYDKLSMYYSNAEGKKQDEIRVSGNTSASASAPDSWGWAHLTAYIDPSFSYNMVSITYSKDSSGDKGLDTAYIKNLTINGRVITNAAPIDELRGSYAFGDTNATLNGNGIITVEGASAPGTYTVIDAEAKKIAFTVDGVYYEATVGETTLTDETPNVELIYSGIKSGSYTTNVIKPKNTQITLLVPESTTDYRFAGWYTDAELTSKVESGTIVLSDYITLYAKYENAVTIYFDNNGAITTVSGVYFENDTVKSEHLTAPERDGWRFDGWYTSMGTDGEWGDKVTTSTVLTRNHTFYAKWSQEVTIHWMDGTTEVERPLVTTTYCVGDKLANWDVADYYTASNKYDSDQKTKRLAGWYTADGTDGEWGDKLVYSTVFNAAEVYFYAKWQNQVTVSIYDGETLLATLYGKDHGCFVGDSASSSIYSYKPTDNMYDKTAKRFAAIYTNNGITDGAWGDKVTSSLKLNEENVTFYAKFELAVTVNFYDNNGTSVKTITNKFQNDKLTSEDIPAALTDVLADGKVFDDWYLMNGADLTDVKAVKDTVLTETVYNYKAKYIVPSPLMGTYDGFESWNGSYRKWVSYTTITANGTVSGFKSGKITDYNAETGTFTLVNGSSEYFGYYDAAAKAFAINCSSGLSNGLGTDTYVLIATDNKENVHVESSLYITYDSNKTSITTITFDSKSITVVIRNNKLYADVTVAATDELGNDVDIASAKIITVTRGGAELTKFSVDNGVTADE